MKKHSPLILILLSLILMTGCSPIKEMGKMVLGTSTRALERERTNAIRKVFDCSFDDCYEAVLKLARTQEFAGEENEEGHYDIFQKDHFKGYVVVMGVTGNVDTTEVGIFLTSRSRFITEIDISSLSSSAKRTVADVLFKELAVLYTEQ